MHFTTLFQLTALAALLDPILAQLWNISAYETDTCAQTSLFFEEVRMDANLDNPCYSFGTLAKSAQVSLHILKRGINPEYEISTRIHNAIVCCVFPCPPLSDIPALLNSRDHPLSYPDRVELYAR